MGAPVGTFFAVAWLAPGKNRAYIGVTNRGGADAGILVDRAVSALLDAYPPEEARDR